MEDRCLMSAYSLLSSSVYSAAQYLHVAPVITDVPNLQGVDFHLISSNGKPPHDLSIQTEVWQADGSAVITGTWSGGSSHAFSGTLSYDAQGNLHICVSWTGGAGQNYLDGTITRNSSPYIFGSQWHLDGNVIASGAGGGPGHVSGNSQSPFVFYAAALMM
jgi:hypothetical protein